MKILNTTIILSSLTILTACGGGGSGNDWTEAEKQARKAIGDSGGAYSVFDTSFAGRSSQQTRGLQKRSRALIPLGEVPCSLGGFNEEEEEVIPETTASYAKKSWNHIFTACKYNTQNEKDSWLQDANFLEGTRFLRELKGVDDNNNPKGLSLYQVEYTTNLSIHYNDKFIEKTIALDDIFIKEPSWMPITVQFDTAINKLNVNGSLFIKIEDEDDFTQSLALALNKEVNNTYKIIGSDESGIEFNYLEYFMEFHYKKNENEERFQDKNWLYSDFSINVDQTIFQKNSRFSYKIETIKPLKMNTNDTNPSSGEINFHTNKGKTLVKLLVLDKNNIKLSVDLEKDGVIDYTEEMKWSEF